MRLTLRTVRCVHCGCMTHWEPLTPQVGDKRGVNLNIVGPDLVASV